MAVSEIVLWIIVIAQGLVILGLMREVGLIQLRIGPSYAMEGGQGLPFGSEAPTLEALDPEGGAITVGGVPTAPQLLVFLSPTCGVCHELIGPLQVLARAERRHIDVVAICGAKASDCRAFLAPVAHRCSIVVDGDGALKKAFNVTGSSFALVVDVRGRVGQSGLVNNLQHLEHLLRSLSPATGEIQLAPGTGTEDGEGTYVEEASIDANAIPDGRTAVAASPDK